MSNACRDRLAPLALLLFASAALGQPGCEPGWAEPFPNVPLITGGGFSEVRALAVFDAGSGPKLYAGGLFTQASGQPARGFMRWEADHWEEAAVVQGTGLSGTPVGIYYLTVMDIGSGPELFAGGQFSSIDGVPVTGIARWNGQTWSAMGAGFDLQVRALTMFDDGTGPTLYAAGRFTKSGTTTVRRLARWTGSAWEEFGGGLGSYGVGFALGVYDLGQGPRLYVGGTFSIPSTTPGEYWQNIAAWDGTSWSGLGFGLPGADPGVMQMDMFDHGAGPQLTTAGRFSLGAFGLAAPRVARWTGSEWVQVGPTLPGGDYITSMVVSPGPTGPTLYIGGWFSAPGNPIKHVARLENEEWASLGGGMSYYVRCMIATEEAGQPVVYASGLFSYAGDAMANQVARWDGERWHGFEHGRGLANGYGWAAQVFNDGSGERIFVGGRFDGAGAWVCNGVAAWDGEAWQSVGGGVTFFGATYGSVVAFERFDDGSGSALYAGGLFDRAGTEPCASVARWDGTQWEAPGGDGVWQLTGTGTWTPGAALALMEFDDGAGPVLYVGGRFERAAAAPAAGIARWNGTEWSGLASGAGVKSTESVEALCVCDEGAGPRLFAGGTFETIAGVAALGVARWDGAAWSAVGGGFPAIAAGNAAVTDLAVLHSGTGSTLIAAGGYFGAPQSNPLINPLLLARWDGQLWTPLTGGSGTVPLTGLARHIWFFDDGNGPALYVGGGLHLSATTPPVGLLRRRADVWDLPGGGITITSPGQSMGIYGSAVRREGDHDILLMTGMFSHAGGVESVGVAEWRACRACYGDCSRDGALTAADFGCFQSRFLTADPWADCNTDGALTVQDFGCFQTKFAEGCP